MDNSEIKKLAYDFTYQRYILNKDKTKHLFKDLSVSDYVILHSVINMDNKVYLKDLSQNLELPVSKMSNIATNLRNKGLVFWSHDGDGSDGTYLSVTDTGINLMNLQEEKLKNYYERVIKRFGLRNTVDLLSKLTQLEKIMDEEFIDE